MPAEFTLPENFLLGAATSSYQVEGNNTNNDWYIWEKTGKVPFRCGAACDSYNRFEEDFGMAKSLGHNCHRISFEWSRIQPDKGRFDSGQISHYKNVVDALIKRHIEPVVTLHHFTNPLWFYNEGGWLNRLSSNYFCEYAERVVHEFSGKIKWWVTINEPVVYAYNSYLRGIWPPGCRSFKKALTVIKNLELAHNKIYQIIKDNDSNAKAGFAKHLRGFSECKFTHNVFDKTPVLLRDYFFNWRLLNRISAKRRLDFIGVNFYTKDYVRASFKKMIGQDCTGAHHPERRNNLGWIVSPGDFYETLIRLKRYNLPVLITENGTTEDKDELYEEYLFTHLKALCRAKKEGLNIFGYLWWSLVDNFEWDSGFGPKFGLIGLDTKLNRRIKPFAYKYKDICVNKKIPHSTSRILRNQANRLL